MQETVGRFITDIHKKSVRGPQRAFSRIFFYGRGLRSGSSFLGFQLQIFQPLNAAQSEIVSPALVSTKNRQGVVLQT